MASVPVMVVICPSCSKHLRVPVSAAGKTARCPSCGASVALPAAEGGDTTPKPVVLPLPSGTDPANPFDFDAAPAPDSPAPAPEPAERVDLNRCVLCGDDDASEDFYICTSAEDGVVLRWINFPVRACEECFGSVSRFRTLQKVCAVAAFLSLVVLVGVGVLVAKDKLLAFSLALAALPLLASAVGAGVSALQRRELIKRPALAPTLKRLRSAYHKATGVWEVVFTPVVEPVKGETATSVR